MRIGLIGAGAVGTGVGVLLRRQGHQVVAVASRTRESAARAAERLQSMVASPLEVARAAEVVLVTTSDDAIGTVVAEVAQEGGFHQGQTVVHMSGSLTTEVLEPAARLGARVVAVHPLQSCADADRAVANLPGSIFSIQGEEEAYPVAETLVRDLGGDFFHIDKDAKALYHAAAVVASNYLVTLLDLSLQLLEASGMPQDLAFKGLLPLVQGTLSNLAQMGSPAALTGPIARGDVGTVADHLEAMAQACPSSRELYASLGLATVEVARRKGSLRAHDAALLEVILAQALANTDSPGAEVANQGKNLL